MKHSSQLKFILLSILCAAVFYSCSDDKSILGSPSVEFAASEYKVKIGKEMTLEPKVENATDAIYSWKLDGKIISTEQNLVFKGNVIGECFVTFRVDAENGFVEKQIKVSVLDKLPPEINIAPSLISFVGQELEVKPEILYAQESDTYEWRLEGTVVSNKPTYTFKKDMMNTYKLTLKVTNEDGIAFAETEMAVVPELQPALFFDDGRYLVPADTEMKRMSVPIGKSLALAPTTIMIGKNATYEWSVNGVAQSEKSKIFKFTPAEQKEYLISVTAKEGNIVATTQVKVECTAAEGTYFREATAKSKSKSTTCFEFIPAPGQFVNYQEGSTAEQARKAIQNSLDSDSYTGSSWIASLGAYGGYFTTGFDHSVKNEEGPDLMIVGNAFPNWSEPGIIWVMQDENGNGLPDDTWYELKGSETGKEETEQRYALTYFRPTSERANIIWVDNLGNSGSIDNNGYHNQKSYFPMFITEPSYTLTGTRLKTTFVASGIETNLGFDWGYVDNLNSRDGFDIDDAIQQNGELANLKYIDFVKVHTAQQGKGAALGEISTEVGAPVDYRLFKKTN